MFTRNPLDARRVGFMKHATTAGGGGGYAAGSFMKPVLVSLHLRVSRVLSASQGSQRGGRETKEAHDEETEETRKQGSCPLPRA